MDIETTRRFYRDSLGFEVTDTAEDTLSARLADSTLIFTVADLWKAPVGATATFYFTVSDVDSYFESVKDKVTVSWPLQDMPYGSREFGLCDCNGYTLAFQARYMKPGRDAQDPVRLDDADINGSRFSNVNLEGTEFRNVNLRKASVVDAALQGATFRDCNFTDATIDDSNTQGPRIDGVTVGELLRAYRQSSRS